MDIIETIKNGLDFLDGFLGSADYFPYLLIGVGLFFTIYLGFPQVRYFGQAVRIVKGKYSKKDDPGDTSHFAALSTALSGTVGTGNIGGVALAIWIGGPAAIFWMWVSALVGIATKFYTCTLAVMYRGRDSEGQLQGGPMYIIREALGPRWRPLAYFFALAGLLGTMPIFQVNQLTEIIREAIAVPAGWTGADDHFLFDLLFGLLLAAGMTAVPRMRAQFFPDIVSDSIDVSVRWDGAGAGEGESRVSAGSFIRIPPFRFSTSALTLASPCNKSRPARWPHAPDWP